MAKSASSVDISPDPGAAPPIAKLRKTRERKAPPTKPVAALDAGSAALSRAVTATANSPAVKPLLIGVGIGAALVGTAVVMRSKSGRSASISPFHGPNSALAGALTKTALFALARVVSGQTMRAVATRALLEVADAWKA
jgi:hypothetical protein